MPCRRRYRDWILVTGQPGCGKTTAVRKLTQVLQDAGFKVQGFVTEEVKSSSSSPSSNNKKTTDNQQSRSGFDIVTVPDGQRGRLARKQGLPSKWPSTGPYRVDVDSIDRLAVPTLIMKNDVVGGQDDTDDRNHNDDEPIIYILDEIGRMELHSEKFRQAVQELLEQSEDMDDVDDDDCDDHDSSSNNKNHTYDVQSNSKRPAPALPQRLVGAVTAPRYGHRVAFCDMVTTRKGIQVHNLTKKTRDQVTEDLVDYIRENWITKNSNGGTENAKTAVDTSTIKTA